MFPSDDVLEKMMQSDSMLPWADEVLLLLDDGSSEPVNAKNDTVDLNEIKNCRSNATQIIKQKRPVPLDWPIPRASVGRCVKAADKR